MWNKVQSVKLDDAVIAAECPKKTNELILVYHEFLDETGTNILHYEIELQVNVEDPAPVNFHDAVFIIVKYQDENINFNFDYKFLKHDTMYRIKIMDTMDQEKRSYRGFIIRSESKELDVYTSA